MKLKTTSRPTIFRWAKAALVASCAMLLPHLQAQTQAQTQTMNFTAGGFSGSWMPSQFNNLSVFTLGAGSGATDTLSGNAVINGSVGVAGAGNISLSNSASIKGNLSYTTNGTLTRSGTGTTITGGIYQNSATNTYLSAGVAVANAVSSWANQQTASSGYPTTIDSNTSLTLTSSGNAVLKLTDFELSNNATLTLQGSAKSSFIIDVSQTFSLANANVKLSGGIQWDEVIFNVVNSGSATLTGNSNFTGVLLAPSRSVSLSGTSVINGLLVANTVALSGSAVVNSLPIVSP